MKISITDFSRRGMTDELRGSSGFALVAGFDTERSDRLQPTQNLSATTLAAGTITDHAIDTYSDVSGDLYGLGSNSTNPALFKWDTGNNRWIDHVTAGFTGVAENILTPYHSYFYGAKGGTHIWRGEIDGSPAPTTWQSLSYTTFADIVYHPADDRIYFLYDNKVGHYDGTTYTAVDLTLPSDFIITSGIPAYDYLLAGGYDTSRQDAVIYWWDRDSGLSTISAKNILDRVSAPTLFRVLDKPYAIVSVYDYGKTEIRIYSLATNGAVLINRFRADTITLGRKWEFDSKCYFACNITQNGTAYHGMLEIDEQGHITLENYDSSITNDVSSCARLGIRSWLYDSTGNVFSSTGFFVRAGIFDTRIYRANDLKYHLDFKGMTIYTEPLPSGGSIVLKARNKTSDSFITLATFSTAGDVEHSITKTGSSTKPSISPEWQFRIESTGGTVITGIYGELEEIKKTPY